MIKWRQQARRKLEKIKQNRLKVDHSFPDFEKCIALIENQAKEQARIKGEAYIGVEQSIMFERLELMLGTDRLKEIAQYYHDLPHDKDKTE